MTPITLTPPSDTVVGSGSTVGHLSERQVREIAVQALTPLDLTGKRVLLIVPDATRTAPVGQLFRVIHDLIGTDTRSLDVMIALGTHPAMSAEAINRRLDITAEERTSKFGRVQVFNHAWNDPTALVHVGTLKADEIGALSGGLFEMDVEVTINRAVFDYDQLIIVGPVFPHEVVGFSGGNKYLFPGVRGIGTYKDGVERPRIQVTLATQIPEDVCRAINLGYRDPRTIHVAGYQNREDDGILYVPKAGEMLHRLRDSPAWARL